MPTILRCYSQRQTNRLFCSVVEFLCRQFYLLHRKPFLLQMCGSVANILDTTNSDFEINPMKVKAKVIRSQYEYYLLLIVLVLSAKSYGKHEWWERPAWHPRAGPIWQAFKSTWLMLSWWSEHFLRADRLLCKLYLRVCLCSREQKKLSHARGYGGTTSSYDQTDGNGYHYSREFI